MIVFHLDVRLAVEQTQISCRRTPLAAYAKCCRGTDASTYFRVLRLPFGYGTATRCSRARWRVRRSNCRRPSSATPRRRPDLLFRERLELHFDVPVVKRGPATHHGNAPLPDCLSTFGLLGAVVSASTDHFGELRPATPARHPAGTVPAVSWSNDIVAARGVFMAQDLRGLAK